MDPADDEHRLGIEPETRRAPLLHDRAYRVHRSDVIFHVRYLGVSERVTKEQ
jgi:hypothetical protein